jgi:predicted permease
MIPLFYRLILRLYPREFRDRFGAELLSTASALNKDAARRRWPALRDACATALGVRAELRRERARLGPGSWISDVLSDLRLAVRTLRKVPGFTTAAVLTLGLGIGAHTVVYAVVDAMVLRPLPFGDRNDRLVTVHSTHPTQAPDWDDADLSHADLVDLRDRSGSLEALEGVLHRNFSVATTEDAARVLGASVTPGLFSMLGATPAEGRLFRPDEGAAPGFEQVVILSHALWQRLFAGDRQLIGRTVLINARAVTVIGIMQEGFTFPEQHQLWLPYKADRTIGRSNRTFLGVGLLRPGVRVEQARVDANRVAVTLSSAYPETNRDWGVHVMPLRDLFISGVDAAGMLTAVSLLLLVACANVAGLLVARGTSRERELVTRAALGAGRGRLTRLLLSESIVIAAMGGTLGVILSSWGLQALLSSITELPVYWAQPRIDARVVTSAVLVSSVVALIAGLAPAWRLSRIDVATASQASPRSVGASRSHRRFQHGLVVTQVAVSLTLLVSATLLARDAIALQHADAGFDPAQVLSGRFYIAGDAYDPIAARVAAVDRVVAALSLLPGATAAAATSSIPADDGGTTLRVRPAGVLAGSASLIGVQSVATTSGLWRTLGLSLVEGRTFQPSEVADPEADVALVNQRLASLFWPNASAMDRVVDIVNARGDVTVSLRIIGVAPDLLYEEFGEATPQSQLNVYVPYGRSGGRTMALLVRAQGDPAALLEPMHRAVRGVDPSFASFDRMTMQDRRAMTTWGERFLATTFSGFAVAAVLLACLGTYGVVAYAAVQRRREVGVRLAIGATPGDVVALFLRSGARLGAIGLCVGLPIAALGASRLGGGLITVSAWDPAVWVLLPIAMLIAILTASLIPARRAGRVDPCEALRD